MIKRGSKVRVVKMDTAGGMDWQAKRLDGKVFTVRFIDSAGQIHLEETGIALIPGVDEDEIVTLLEKGTGLCSGPFFLSSTMQVLQTHVYFKTKSIIIANYR